MGKKERVEDAKQKKQIHLLILKYGGVGGLVLLLISCFTIWKAWTSVIGSGLLVLTLVWRTFKWWLYRGTINLGKKRPLKKPKNSNLY